MNVRNDSFEVEKDIGVIKERSRRGALLTFGTQVPTFLISFASQIILAHLLSPGQFGVAAMAAPVIGFAAIFNDLGFQQATIQKPKIVHAEVSLLFWVNTGVSASLAVLLVLLSPVIAWMYGEPQVGPVVRALAGVLFVGSLSAQSYALLNRRMQFTSLAIIDVAGAVAGVVTGIGFAWLGAGYWALVLQSLATNVVMVSLIWNRAKWRPSLPRWDRDILPMIRFGQHMTTFKIVSYFSTYFANIMIGIINGPAALGVFERAFKLVLQPIGQITAPINRIAVPMLSRVAGSDSHYRNAYIRMLQIILLVSMPGLLCASVMSHQVVLGLLGPAWLATAPILQCLSIVGIFSLYSNSTFWLFVSQNRVREQMTCGFVSSGLVMVSLLTGVHWGPTGIATSYALFAPLVHGVFVWRVTRKGPVSRRDIVTASYPIVTAAITAAIALHFAEPYFPAGTLLDLATGGVMSYAVTALVLLCFPGGRRLLGGLRGLAIRRPAIS